MSKLGILLAIAALLNACATRSQLVVGDEEPTAEPELQWPVLGAALTQKFRPHKGNRPRRHAGIDLAARKGTPILAADHGVVVYAGHGFTGFGRLVIVRHVNSEYETYYAHLSRYKVEKGDVVKRGDIVGLMGNSGRSTGTHLHFEVRHKNVAQDPLDFLPPTNVSSQQANP